MSRAAVKEWRSLVTKGKRRDDCWGWLGGLRGNYPRFCAEGVDYFAHRFAWELGNGPIPEGMHVLHACDQPLCSNPRHLFIGNQQDNMHDRWTKLRRGDMGKKLTWELVAEIRELAAGAGLSRSDLALLFGVSSQTIGEVVRLKSWHPKYKPADI